MVTAAGLKAKVFAAVTAHATQNFARICLRLNPAIAPRLGLQACNLRQRGARSIDHSRGGRPISASQRGRVEWNGMERLRAEKLLTYYPCAYISRPVTRSPYLESQLRLPFRPGE